MSHQDSLRRLSLRALVVLVLLAPAIVPADTVERTFDVAAGGTLTIDTDQGSIDVRSVPGNQVRIKVEREVRGGDDDDFELRFDQLPRLRPKPRVGGQIRAAN